MTRHRPTIAVLVQDSNTRVQVCRAVQAAAAGAKILSGASAEEILDQASGVPLLGAFTTAAQHDQLLKGLAEQKQRTQVCIFTRGTNERLLRVAIGNPRVVSLMAEHLDGPCDWELVYLSRRLVAPAEPSPHMGHLLSWGATTVKWEPRTTEDLRKVVNQVERLAANLGVSRRAAKRVSIATHELLMNAMYDAPVDASGKPRYALNRRAPIHLEPDESPTLWFTVDARRIALDAIDPFGRLPRNRFFDGVLRGHLALTAENPEDYLDTSHGGAGLGLHTLYSNGALLRAELLPMRRTHVSWMLDRTVAPAELRDRPKSLYFLPILAR